MGEICRGCKTKEKMRFRNKYISTRHVGSTDDVCATNDV